MPRQTTTNPLRSEERSAKGSLIVLIVSCATRKPAASRQDANHYDWHVRIKSAIRMLMEFNISGNRKPGHRASKADPVHDQSTGCECSEYENDQTNERSIVPAPPFPLGKHSQLSARRRAHIVCRIADCLHPCSPYRFVLSLKALEHLSRRTLGSAAVKYRVRRILNG